MSSRAWEHRAASVCSSAAKSTGFHQVTVEARRLSSLHVLVLPIAGHSNELDAVESRILPQSPRELIAVELGKTDVEQCHMGPEAPGDLERLPPPRATAV